MITTLSDLSDEQLLVAFHTGVRAAADVLVWRHDGHPIVSDARPAAFVWADILSGKIDTTAKENEQ